MPELCRFRGIVILMFSNEGVHNLAHFHARYAGQKATFLADGTLLAVLFLTHRRAWWRGGPFFIRPRSQRTGSSCGEARGLSALTRWIKLSP